MKNSDVTVPVPPEDLKTAHAENRLLPWVGSGLSSAIVGEDLPGYGDLILLVMEAAKARLDHPVALWDEIVDLVHAGDFKSAAETLRGMMSKDAFTLIIRDLLRSSRPRPSQHHVMLNLMNFPVFLTTNYDRVLDQIVRPRPEVLTYRDADTLHALLSDRASLFRDGEAPKIFKLNGDLAAPPTIVMGQSDALELFDASKPTGEALTGLFEQIMSEHSILFMGYSFGDPDYRRLLIDTGRNLKAARRSHFALVERNKLDHVPDRAALEEHAGITFMGFDLDFENEDEDVYRGLWQFLSQVPHPTEFDPAPGKVARTFFPGDARPEYLRLQDEFEQHTDVFRFITPTLTNGFATQHYLNAVVPGSLKHFKGVVEPDKWQDWQDRVLSEMRSRANTFVTRLRAGAEARILCSAKKLSNDIATGSDLVLERYAYVLKWLDDPHADVELRLFTKTEDSVSLTSFASLMCGDWAGSDIAVAYATQATVAEFITHVFEINTEFSKDMLVIFEREWARAMPSVASTEVIRDGLRLRGFDPDPGAAWAAHP
ncbi:MAG: SIR2 family protein [Pseudomonadota bacterium]